MEMDKSILVNIRESLGLSADDNSFDEEILMHINSAIGSLNQNGVGSNIVVFDDTTVWNDLMDESQVEGNVYFKMVPLFIKLSTKVVFDPPPPSLVDYYSKLIDEHLWRLKVAYSEGGL